MGLKQNQAFMSMQNLVKQESFESMNTELDDKYFKPCSPLTEIQNELIEELAQDKQAIQDHILLNLQPSYLEKLNQYDQQLTQYENEMIKYKTENIVLNDLNKLKDKKI